MTFTRLLAIALLSVPVLAARGTDQTFDGVISDEMCALNHASMRMGPTDAECAHACAEEHEAAYVLVDGKNVYKLSDQPAAKALAGKKARVVGTLDEPTQTIAVKSITGN